jgi:hypothetical protein
MRNDPTISFARRMTFAPILSTPWSVVAYDDAPEGATDFIDEEVQRLRFDFVRSAMIGWFDYGWAPFEKIFEQRGDRVGVSQLKSLLQDYTDILVTEDGALQGITQNIDKEVRLTLDECVVLSFDYEGTDWYGTPIAKSYEDPYDKWNTIEEAAARYDKKIAGTSLMCEYPVGETPLNGTMTDNYEIAKTILNTLEASGKMAVPLIPPEIADILTNYNQWKVSLLSDNSAGRGAFTERQKYLDALKVRGTGLPERSVLEGQFGTKAEAEAHADFAILNLELMLQWIVKQFNQQCTRHVMRLNYGEAVQDLVAVETPTLTDAAKTFLRSVYTQILAHPELGIEELDNVDRDALRDSLGVPYQEAPELMIPDPLQLPTV